MRNFYRPTALAMLIATTSSCAAYPRDQIGFWDQKVAFTSWGFTMATEFGPFNIGYLQWNRNVTPLRPTSPVDVLNRATEP